MEYKMNVNIEVVTDIEVADTLLLLSNCDNFTKNKVYNIYYDKNENPILLNDELDYDSSPLNNSNNILLSVKVTTK